MMWFADSWLCAVVKTVGYLLRLMPFSWALALARVLGLVGYYIFPKKTRTIYLNLKTVYGGTYTHGRLKQCTRKVFVNVVCNFIELLFLPRLKQGNAAAYVVIEGKENLEKARQKGKGVIFAAVHGGSWELASLMGALQGCPYNIVVNRQSKTPRLDALLGEYRRSSGAGVIVVGEDTRDILRAIKNNEIMAMVIDQGGREGMVVPFLGQRASMSTGAMRLALKYGCAVCPVWMKRTPSGHVLTVFPQVDMVSTGHEGDDVRINLMKALSVIEPLVKENPEEYFWFYKVFKYSDEVLTLILDDGKTGHLRQSQALAKALGNNAVKKNKTLKVSTITVQYRFGLGRVMMQVLGLAGLILPVIRGRWMMALVLSEQTMKALDAINPQVVISTGSALGALAKVNAWIHRAKTIAILKQGLMPLGVFDRVVLPKHDGAVRGRPGQVFFTEAAPNLIDKTYLQENEQGLLAHFSHLKSDIRVKVGVLIGGDTKGVKTSPEVIRQLLTYLVQACEHYNASLLLTTSRRTPPEIDRIIAREMGRFKRCALCVIANEQDVPQAVGGILSLSDLVLVSSESISMVSESVAAGKMTVVFSLADGQQQFPRTKYDTFVSRLQSRGYVMAPQLKEIPSTIATLLSRKIQLKTLDDQDVLLNATAGFC